MQSKGIFDILNILKQNSNKINHDKFLIIFIINKILKSRIYGIKRLKFRK